MSTAKCERGHKTEINPDEIEKFLENPLCPNCDSIIVDYTPNHVSMYCSNCGQTCEIHWKDAYLTIGNECMHCISAEQDPGFLYIAGTKSHTLSEYNNFCPRNSSKIYSLPKRDDYHELVTHLTNEENFLSIFLDMTIKANPTGSYKVPAVCLTEIPIKYLDTMMSNFGEFGIVFRKIDILRNGGGPAINLSDELLSAQDKFGGFSENLKPFINIIRPKIIATEIRKLPFYYLLEREWRVPHNIDLHNISPVGLVTRKGMLSKVGRDIEFELLINIFWEYHEIVDGDE